MLELYLWAGLGILLLVPLWFEYTRAKQLLPPAEVLPFILRQHYYSVLFGSLVFLFPWAFRLIFDGLPLETLRMRRRSVQSRSESASNDLPTRPTTAIPDADALHSTAALLSGSPQAMLAALAADSKRLSERIYTRAGVYLLVGVLIALTGLMFFYLQSIAIAIPNDLAALLATLAPRIGVLFFIQLVAFFFLRQYRTAMDEFRYFEAIKRNREENLALVLLSTTKWEDIDIQKVIQVCAFNAHIGRLASGETTDLLESKKLSKDELAIFDKIVEVLAKVKS